MNRTLNLLYSLLFCSLLLALCLWSLRAVFGFSAASETSVLDGKLTQAFEKHYDAEFPVKQLGTNLWALASYTLFGEGRQGVIIGQDGWLFSDEEFKPATQPDQLQDNWRLVNAVRLELERRGVTLVLALLPAKARLYPEHLNDDRPALAQQRLYPKAHEMMRQTGVNGPDLLPALREAKAQEPVFLRTDTHWTPFGAEVAARSLAEHLARQGIWQHGDQTFVTEAVDSREHKGDLLSFLPLEPYFADRQLPAEQLRLRLTRAAEGQEESAEDALFVDAQPAIALVGTSYSANANWNFAGALKQALGSDLLNYAEEGRGPLVPMLNLLQQGDKELAGLRLVIWEFPERYLMLPSDLSKLDAAWLARLRNDEKAASRAALQTATGPEPILQP